MQIAVLMKESTTISQLSNFFICKLSYRNLLLRFAWRTNILYRFSVHFRHGSLVNSKYFKADDVDNKRCFVETNFKKFQWETLFLVALTQ